MVLTPHSYTGGKEQLNMQSNTALLALKEHLNSHAKKPSYFWHPIQVVLFVRLSFWGCFFKDKKKRPMNKPACVVFWFSNIYMFTKIKISMHNTSLLQIKV